MNDSDNRMNSIAVDSLLNFETIKHYNAEELEVERYKKAYKMYFFSFNVYILLDSEFKISSCRVQNKCFFVPFKYTSKYNYWYWINTWIFACRLFYFIKINGHDSW